MKLKRRRVLEVPPKIRSFISSVTSAALEDIEEPLRGVVWEFDKGDVHQWVDLFNHFDSFFEKYVKPRKDLQLEDNFLEADSPFPREAVLQILRVVKIVLEKCTNKHFYSSYETKDFWREAQILSKLHHPNVVAFYGVVPDGVGGTLATLTEYMVT